jgi:hypothetical protein
MVAVITYHCQCAITGTVTGTVPSLKYAQCYILLRSEIKSDIIKILKLTIKIEPSGLVLRSQ